MIHNPTIILTVIALIAMLIGSHVYNGAVYCLSKVGITHKTAIKCGVLGALSVLCTSAYAATYVMEIAKL